MRRGTEADARRHADALRRRLGEDLERFCADAGITPTRLAGAAGLNRSFVARTLRGEAKPTFETYVRLAAPLGLDFSARLYPNTGPAIRDRHQAPILEWLLDALHPRWRAFTEVSVVKPSKGSIDVVLHDGRAHEAIATEIESDLRRLEQQVRWHREKAAALPSWSGWATLTSEPRVSRLLIVRRTRATRTVASDFGRQLTVAYPAHPDDAMAALSGTAPWPGPALVWVLADRKGVRYLPGRGGAL